MDYAIFRITEVNGTIWREQQPAVVGTPDEGWQQRFWMGKHVAQSHASAMSANESDLNVKCFEVKHRDGEVVARFFDGERI